MDTVIAPASASFARASSHAFRLKEGSLQQPTMAWPTVLLAAVGLSLWLGAAYAGIAWSLPMWATLPVSSTAIYMCFTPMHDATHSSVAKRPYRFVNELVGWLCSVPFIAVPHSLFRWLHLRHHKYTNDPELDPDYMVPPTGIWSFMQFPVDTIANWIRTIYKYGDSIDRSTCISSILFFLFEIAVITYAIHHGFGSCLLWYWFLPMLCAMVFLAYVFDHLPHHAHEATASQSVYACTATLDGIFNVEHGESWWLFTWLTLGQNYHSIHHIFPTLPWYAYERVWHGHRNEFLKAGVPLQSLFGRSSGPKIA